MYVITIWTEVLLMFGEYLSLPINQWTHTVMAQTPASSLTSSLPPSPLCGPRHLGVPAFCTNGPCLCLRVPNFPRGKEPHEGTIAWSLLQLKRHLGQPRRGQATSLHNDLKQGVACSLTDFGFFHIYLVFSAFRVCGASSWCSLKASSWRPFTMSSFHDIQC